MQCTRTTTDKCVPKEYCLRFIVVYKNSSSIQNNEPTIIIISLLFGNAVTLATYMDDCNTTQELRFECECWSNLSGR